MYDKLIRDLRPKTNEVLEKLVEEYQKLRTGKANTALVEGVKVSYYGTETPLKQMAQITTPDAAHIVITPWDKNSLSDIELGIRNSGLNLSPVNDGKSIRINLPPMTEERRQELVKHVKSLAEEAKVVVRNLRQEVWNQVKDLEKKSEITEDDRYRAEEDLNKLVDDLNRRIDEQLDEKKEEIIKI